MAIPWTQTKAQLNSAVVELNKFDTNAIRSLGQEINSNIAQYVNTAGISSNPNGNQYYTQANTKFETLVDKQREYLSIINSLIQTIKELSTSSSINEKLQTAGSLRNDIVNLKNELKQAKQDADTSRTREESVKDTKTDVSWYQGFGAKVGFTKPLHEISIPILIGFSVLSLFLSGLILRDFFTPSVNSFTDGIVSENMFSLFTDSRFYSVLAGVVIVLIVTGILTYYGYLGKNIT
jgi:Na+-translocating ferredoxin:NAD+ oxidoreductase RnfC subunit